MIGIGIPMTQASMPFIEVPFRQVGGQTGGCPRTCAIDAEAPAMPPKPRAAAVSAMTRKARVQVSMLMILCKGVSWDVPGRA